MHTIDFPAEALALKNIYSGGLWKEYGEEPIACGKIGKIYGPLRFPPVPQDRCYTVGSFVASIDGRLAFPASPDGNLVAKRNRLDPDGGFCDYWILNMVRSACDAVIMGGLMLKREPELSGRIYDQDLLDQRRRDGRNPVLLHVLLSGRGDNLPLDHQVYFQEDIPTLTVLSPEGADLVERSCAGRKKGALVRLPDVASEADLDRVPADLLGRGGNLLLAVGSGSRVDPLLLLKALRRGGVGRALVESPTFDAALMEAEALDELFLNTSGLFIGGKAITIGENYPPFTPERHPHARVVTIHTHSDSFFYTRYRFWYGA